MKNLALQFTGGKFYTMFFTPNSPLYHTGKLFVPMQEVSIKMYFNDPSVFMLSPAASDAAAIKAKALSDDVIKITLNLCQVTVAPSLYRQITAARTRSTARYPLHAFKIRTFSMADGLTDFDQGQLFTNRVPVRILGGLLHNSAFNGAYRRSPFAFEKFGLTLIRMTISGEEYPYKNALELVHNDGSKDNFGYRRLLETMASYQTGEAPIVLPEMWGQTIRLNHDLSDVLNASGNVTLFAFNFTPDGRPDAPTFHPPQSGNDPDLAPYFTGVFPSDRLPARPVEDRPRGYIVNIDTHDKPGSHWVAMWTHDGGCTVMDSFAIPLAMYKPHDLLDWLTHHFQGFESNGHAIQAVDSQACGLYVLMSLIHMSVGGTLDTFMNIFSRHDFVNDRRVAQWFQHLVGRDMTWHRFKQFRQANHVPVRLLDMVMLQ